MGGEVNLISKKIELHLYFWTFLQQQQNVWYDLPALLLPTHGETATLRGGDEVLVEGLPGKGLVTPLGLGG